jgi:hypothetical protein
MVLQRFVFKAYRLERQRFGKAFHVDTPQMSDLSLLLLVLILVLLR